MTTETILKLIRSENVGDIKIGLEMLFNKMSPNEALDFLCSHIVKLNPKANGKTLFLVGPLKTLVVMYYSGTPNVIEKSEPGYNIFVNDKIFEIL